MILIRFVLLIKYSNTKIVFRKIKLIFRQKKLNLKTKNIKILTSLPKIVLQVIKKSFVGAHWDAKKLLKFTYLTKFHNCHHASAHPTVSCECTTISLPKYFKILKTIPMKLLAALHTFSCLKAFANFWLFQ